MSHFSISDAKVNVSNGQSSNWKFVKAGVSQGPILEPLFFLIYINNLPQGLISDPKLFADYTSLFSIINSAKVSASVLHGDLLKIPDCAYQLKMSFNVYQGKQVYFSNATVKITHTQKQLRLT